MHFPDLTLCNYSGAPLLAKSWRVPLLAIGWVEHPHPFTQGNVEAGIVSALDQMVLGMRANFPQHLFRGGYCCSLCEVGVAPSGPHRAWSQENLLIPGRDVVYATPGGIGHYIQAHHYRPPDDFLEAVRRCPDYGSEEYMSALQATNEGAPPPMLPREQDYARSRSKFEAAREEADRLQQPILDEVRRATGVSLENLWRFSQLKERPKEALPIFLAHLRLPYPNGLREVLAHLLAVPEAIGLRPDLVQLYRAEQDALVKLKLHFALSKLPDASRLDEDTDEGKIV